MALEAWDKRLAAADDELAEDQLEFWTNICLCHSLIVEPSPGGGLPVFQVPPSCVCLTPNPDLYQNMGHDPVPKQFDDANSPRS